MRVTGLRAITGENFMMRTTTISILLRATIGCLPALALAGCEKQTLQIGQFLEGDANQQLQQESTGAPDDSESSDGESSDGESSGGEPPADSTGAQDEPPPAPNGAACNPLLTECGAGQSCIWSPGNGFFCGPDASGDGGALGQGCGNIDACDPGLTCIGENALSDACDHWNGCCVEYCDTAAPACSDPTTTCVAEFGIAEDASPGFSTIGLCLPLPEGPTPPAVTECNPLLSDCPEGELCAPTADLSLICVPDVSGDQGAVGDPCAGSNQCDPGLFCIDAAAFAQCDGVGCCTEFCDLEAVDPCTTPNATCFELFDPAIVPPGLENLGGCLEGH